MKSYPFQINHGNIDLVINICQMYYDKQMSQLEIARAVNVSRSQISKILIAARTQGIVNISINNPYIEAGEIKDKLVERFGISGSLILRSYDGTTDAILSNSSGMVTSFLSNLIKDNDIIGVASGYTLYSLGKKIGMIKRDNLTITPLLGGFFSSGATWQANANARILAESLGCHYQQLNSPNVVSTAKLKRMLLNEPEIDSAMKTIDKTTVCLLGIGSAGHYQVDQNDGNITEEDFQKLMGKGNVGGVCNFFFNQEGTIIDFEGYKRMIGITPEQLRGIHTKIGIAFGKEKAEAIIATLKGKWLDYLITDENTAEIILSDQ